MNKVNNTIWPIYVYILLLLLFYSGRDLSTPLAIGIFLIVIAPILLLGLIIYLFRLNYKKNYYFLLFLYGIIPGVLFGLQLAYGLYAMGHGDDPIGAILPFTITGLFFGLISGLLGILINFVINLIKKLK